MNAQYKLFLKLKELENLSQIDFAKRTGKRPERINEWKNGKYLPSFKQLELMADQLGYNLKIELVKKDKRLFLRGL
jgi:transcriptional regulator with XRE-family HTH domain